jgi:hypothetical protein
MEGIFFKPNHKGKSREKYATMGYACENLMTPADGKQGPNVAEKSRRIELFPFCKRELRLQSSRGR